MKESLFKSPQRQSKIGVLIIFFDTLQIHVRAFWPFFVILIFKSSHTYLLFTILIFCFFIVVFAYLKYLNFTFYLDYENEEFIVNEGVFNKTKTTIHFNKIQQVNINQSLIQKFINVYSLDVDTAGTTNKEAVIRAISHKLAVELKMCLLNNNFKKWTSESETIPSNDNLNEEPTLVKISFLSLLKLGITSNHLRSFSLILFFFLTVSDTIHKVTGKDVLHDESVENYVNKNWMSQAFLIIITLFLGLFLIVNILRIVIKYFNYKIIDQKKSLLISYGLLNTKSTIIKPEKVQMITISRNYFQKKLEILQIKIKQVSDGTNEIINGDIEVPGCNEFERDEILKLLFKKIPQNGVMLKPNFRKLGFALFITIGLPLIGYYIFRSYNATLGLQLNYIIPIYIIFVGVVQFFKYKNNRLFFHNDFIIKQSGAWDIHNDIIEPSKIQAITTSQLFWNKSINIGSITLHTAGGVIDFELGNYSKINEYINLYLYKIESSDLNWV